jgi:adenylate cyclase
VRGRDAKEDTVSLETAAREVASVMFLDLENLNGYAGGNDPETIMVMLNQVMADFTEALDRYGASVTAYFGVGLMALLRGANHASRAVSAALDLMELFDELNRPRVVLDLKPFDVRIGISTGEVLMGDVGTYQRIGSAVIGAAADLALRLRAEAEPGLPCISRGSYEQLAEGAFIFKTGSPRTVTLKGHGAQQVWDVIERGAS